MGKLVTLNMECVYRGSPALQQKQPTGLLAMAQAGKAPLSCGDLRKHSSQNSLEESRRRRKKKKKKKQQLSFVCY